MAQTPAALGDALTWLQGQRSPMVTLLERLVRQGSFTGDPAGVAAVVDLLEPGLREAGLTTERIDGTPHGPHLAFRGPAAGPPVFFIGHTDTVFPPGRFEGWTVEGSVGRGPGCFDMKGGLVVLRFALAAAQRAGFLERLPVAGLLVSDEEIGSPGSQPHMRRLASGARAALGFESGRSGDLIVTRRKGTAAMKVVAHGVAAHAGNEHEKGKNAIWALARFVDAAQRLTDRERGVTVSVGTIHGGTTKNTVPDNAVCEVDLRFLSVTDGQRLQEDLRAAALRAVVDGTRIELASTAWRDPLELTQASAALCAAYLEGQRASGLAGGEAPLVGGGSDACTTGAMGVPSIDGLGPRGAGFHTLDERVELDSLVPKAQACLRYLATLAG